MLVQVTHRIALQLNISSSTVNYPTVKHQGQYMHEKSSGQSIAQQNSLTTVIYLGFQLVQVSRPFLVVAMPTDRKLKLRTTTVHKSVPSPALFFPYHHEKCQLFLHDSSHRCTHANLELQDLPHVAFTLTAPAPCPAPRSCSGGPSSP